MDIVGNLNYTGAQQKRFLGLYAEDERNRNNGKIYVLKTQLYSYVICGENRHGKCMLPNCTIHRVECENVKIMGSGGRESQV